MNDIGSKGTIECSGLEYEILMDSGTHVVVIRCKTESCPENAVCSTVLDPTLKILLYVHGLSISIFSSQAAEILHGFVGAFNMKISLNPNTIDLSLKIKRLQVRMRIFTSVLSPFVISRFDTVSIFLIDCVEYFVEFRSNFFHFRLTTK